MADNKKLSVEEILAICRKLDGDGESDQDAGAVAPTSSGEVEAVAEASTDDASADDTAESEPEAPAASKPSKSPAEMSVAEMLAAARGETAKPKASETPKPSPAAKKASPKKGDASKEKSAKEAVSAKGPRDTSSILAAARKEVKPGPLSKAEAAAKGKPVVPKKAKLEVPPMPVRPSFATKAEKVSPAGKEKEDSGRRGFLQVFFGSFLAVGFSTFSITNLLWLLGLARFAFPNVLIEPPSKFRVGFPSDFAPGTVATKFKPQFGVWVVNSEYKGRTEIYALRAVCTHLGCTPNWLEAEQKFKCPCHGSGFYKDGVNFEGPAPRPLERYAIRVADDGQIEIDKSKLFQEEMGQWDDTASYVPV